ncbi:MAG: hypothetical protein ACYSU7_16340 [Planctomycetota bacterium]
MIQVQQQLKKQQTNGDRTALRVSVRDVTGTHHAKMELDPTLRVGAVAEAVASRMSLPSDTSWALRDESTAAFLDDDRSIGDALGAEDRVSVSLVATPRAHLG